MDGLALQLYLIRHGETAWSITGQHTGSTDIPLTPDGEAAVRALGPRLREVVFTRVLSSPARRAQRTCELAGFGSKPDIEPDLAEWNYGDFEGQRTADIQLKQAGWNIWRDGCPHGESPTDVAQRADRLLVRLHSLHGNVILFTHGQFGSALAARWIGLAEPGHPRVAAIALWNATAAQEPV